MSYQLKQREMAGFAGVKPSTWGNVESSPFAVIKREKLIRVLNHLKPPQGAIDRILAKYDETPASPFQIKRREHFQKLNENRRTIHKAEPIRAALIHVVDHAPEGSLCACIPDLSEPQETTPPTYGYQCTLCHAMRALGFAEGWTSQVRASELVATIIADENADHQRLTEAQALAVLTRRTPAPADPDFG